MCARPTLYMMIHTCTCNEQVICFLIYQGIDSRPAVKTPTHGNHGNGNGGDELCNGVDHKGSNGSNGSNGRKKGTCYIQKSVYMIVDLFLLGGTVQRCGRLKLRVCTSRKSPYKCRLRLIKYFVLLYNPLFNGTGFLVQ